MTRTAFNEHHKLIHNWVDDGQLPGVSHLVLQRGEVIDQTLYGYTDIESESPITPTSLFRLASATKFFVSMLLLRLVDKGLLDYDDPLAKFFPEFSHGTIQHADGSLTDAKIMITVEDLLRHSHGYSYGDNDPYQSSLMDAGLLKIDLQLGSDWSHSLDLSAWMLQLSTVPMEFEASTAVSYGLGHDMIGALIERITGESLENAFNHLLAAPLGLNNTFFVVPANRMKDLTSFYQYKKAEKQDAEKSLVRLETAAESNFLTTPKAFSGGGGWDMLGNGGLVTNSEDFARLLQLLLANGISEGEAILKPETIDRLKTDRTHLIGEVLPGHGYSYGLGYQRQVARSNDGINVGNVGKLWWGGSTNPYFFVDPSRDLVSVYLTHTFPFGQMNAAYKLEKLTYAALGES